MEWSVRQSLATASGVVLAVLAAEALGLDDPWWAAISAWIVANPDRSALVTKCVLRVIGTIAGCVLGFAFCEAFGGAIPVLLVGMAAVGGISAYRRFVSPYAYAWVLFGITFLMIVFSHLSGASDLFQFAVLRALEIITGVITAMTTGFVLSPHPAPAAASAAAAAEHDYSAGPAAMIGAALPVVIVVAWSILDLPSAQQVLISSFVLLDRDVGTIHVRGGQRLGGCLLGGAAGLTMIVLGVDSFLAWVAALGGGLFVLARLHHYGGRVAYVGTQGGIALIMALVTGPGPPTDILPVINRLAGMIVGVFIIIVLSEMVAAKLRQPSREPAAAGKGEGD